MSSRERSTAPLAAAAVAAAAAAAVAAAAAAAATAAAAAAAEWARRAVCVAPHAAPRGFLGAGSGGGR